MQPSRPDQEQEAKAQEARDCEQAISNAIEAAKCPPDTRVLSMACSIARLESTLKRGSGILGMGHPMLTKVLVYPHPW